jgi:hypothetical protein
VASSAQPSTSSALRQTDPWASIRLPLATCGIFGVGTGFFARTRPSRATVLGGRGQLRGQGASQESQLAHQQHSGRQEDCGLQCCYREWTGGTRLGQVQHEARRWCGGIQGVPCACGPAEKHRRHVRDDATAGLKGNRVSSIVAVDM